VYEAFRGGYLVSFRALKGRLFGLLQSSIGYYTHHSFSVTFFFLGSRFFFLFCCNKIIARRVTRIGGERFVSVRGECVILKV
jgi:hypothetical protein